MTAVPQRPVALPESHCLTMRANGLLRVIACSVEIGPAIAGVGVSSASAHHFEAVWDTGATGSVISQAVVDACGLVATGMKEVHTAGGTEMQETFLVTFGLPNGVRFTDIPVTKGRMAGINALIGMDIISCGDFAVTNHQGVTVCSFRVPSNRHIDFVEEFHQQRAAVSGAATTRQQRRAAARDTGKKR